MIRAIGIVETISIAAGIETADAMVKIAPVKLFLARPICPGKFLVLVGGEVGAVKNSINEGFRKAKDYLADSILIPRVHEDVFPALEGATVLDDLDSINALGVIETFSVGASILAADAAVKAANVKLMEIRAAVGLGGKSYVTMLGSVSAVISAVEAGRQKAEPEGTLVKSIVIPNVSRDVLNYLL
ncbi:BMC domain-containing protein [Tepidanaerobacter sp. GT38]|uniref:BMC domain-containing protein n=1 Tax=Tepidanaerobacter sp. GT38 TaxID=2722793 RepID=UPI001F443993|nr:BMC domain-containing protein [Tepidanaerobacter sp. GT38]MCG1013010.1 BMC domain-containing protein [Tepidanaerobacter sp. GT38]